MPKLPVAYKSKIGIICPPCAQELQDNEVAPMFDHTPMYKASGKCEHCTNSFEVPPTKLVHSNPIVQEWSITRLVSYLHLKRSRIIELLNNDQIYLDHGEVQVRNIAGPNVYMMIKVRA